VERRGWSGETESKRRYGGGLERPRWSRNTGMGGREEGMAWQKRWSGGESSGVVWRKCCDTETRKSREDAQERLSVEEVWSRWAMQGSSLATKVGDELGES